MKNITQYTFFALLAVQTLQCSAEMSGDPPFVGTVGKSDVAGIGKYGGYDGEYFSRINNITYWFGDPGTNSIVLTPLDWLDGELFLQDVEINDTVIFFGIRQGWNPLPSNVVFRGNPASAWEWREKRLQAGSAGLIPSPPFQFPGTWINVTTSSLATINFISNVVHSLCVSPNLIQYSEALIPPLEADWENELSMFKADAFKEMLELEGGADEDFLVHVLNSSQYQRRFRGLALSYLKDRFDWPATNTVPEP